MGRGCSIVWPGRCPYKTGSVELQRAPYQGARSSVVAVFLFVLVHFPIVSGELQAQKIPPPHNRAPPPAEAGRCWELGHRMALSCAHILA